MSGANNLITQVSKQEASGQTNLINKNSAQNTTQTSTPPPRKKGIFSCFCCGPRDADKERGDEYRKDLTLEPLAEGYLLPAQPSNLAGRKTMVLDLDETLVHSSFKPIANPDFIIPVEIEDQVHKVYVAKRPFVDKFLQELGPYFETVVFTASLSKYADPVLDLLDTHKVVSSRLFREACSQYKGNYVKDLNRLGRDLKGTIILDNSPSSYLFHVENAVPVESWFDDEADTELDDLIPFLKELSKVENVKTFLEARKRDGKLIYK